MHTRRGAGRRSLRAWLAAVAALGTGCVTTYEPLSRSNRTALAEATPITIPFPVANDPQAAAWVQLYGAVFTQLQEAAEAGDVALLDALLASYDKPQVPELIKAQLQGFRQVARGIRFQRQFVANATLRVIDDALPPLGAPLQLELRVPADGAAVVLGGRDDVDPMSFLVAVTFEDEFVDGSVRSPQSEHRLWLDGAIELAGDRVLTLPIAIDADVGSAVRRRVSVWVDMMAGHVGIDGQRVPVRRQAIASGSWTQWPRGYDIVANAPLAALRAGLAKFHEQNFASVYIAALCMPPEQRDEAMGLLIEQVRFGRDDQATVAMVALQKLSGAEPPVGDRDAWLAWWRDRR